MKHIVSIGGGITSTLLLPKLCIERYGKENCVFVMAAVADDEGSSRRFVTDVEKLLDIEITRVSLANIIEKEPSYEILPRGVWAKYTIWDIYFYEGMMGNTLADPCSRELKREVIRWYVRQHAANDVTMHVGITAGEWDRMIAIGANWKREGVKVVADLVEDTTITREYAMAECKRLLGYVPTNYAIRMNHNNCGRGVNGVGFCVKGGFKEKAMLLYYDRKTYLYHETMELLHQQIYQHSSTIMKREKKVGKLRTAVPITLRAFRLECEAKWRGMLPGFDPFEGLEETPACTFCESAA